MSERYGCIHERIADEAHLAVSHGQVDVGVNFRRGHQSIRSLREIDEHLGSRFVAVHLSVAFASLGLAEGCLVIGSARERRPQASASRAVRYVSSDGRQAVRAEGARAVANPSLIARVQAQGAGRSVVHASDSFSSSFVSRYRCQLNPRTVRAHDHHRVSGTHAKRGQELGVADRGRHSPRRQERNGQFVDHSFASFDRFAVTYERSPPPRPLTNCACALPLHE